MKRKSPLEFIESIPKSRSHKTWYDELPIEDRKFVDGIIAEIMKSKASIPLYAVAKSLIKELKIDRAPLAVAKLLKEKINEKC